MYKVIIFDLWNTLAFMEDIDKATQYLKKQLGAEKNAILTKIFRQWHLSDFSIEEFFKRLKNETKLNQAQLLLIKPWLIYRKIKLYPDTKDTLSFLQEKKKQLILVTNSPPPTKEAVQILGLSEYFDKIIFSFEVGLEKPDSRIYELALDGLNVSKKEVLLIGDSLEKDVIGPSKLGFDAILMDRNNISNYQPRIQQLSDLKNIIQ